MATTEVELVTVNVAALPLNATAVAPSRFVPVIVSVVPTGPDAGLKPLIVGAFTITVNVFALVAVPPAVVTETLPVVAPAGTTSS